MVKPANSFSGINKCKTKKFLSKMDKFMDADDVDESRKVRDEGCALKERALTCSTGYKKVKGMERVDSLTWPEFMLIDQITRSTLMCETKSRDLRLKRTGRLKDLCTGIHRNCK